MKRILRSTLDPLPRSLSTPALLTLVTVVVLGTAVTVHRYIESSGGRDANDFSPARVIGEVRASDESLRLNSGPRAMTLTPIRSAGSYCESRSGTAAGCPSTAPVAPVQPSPSASAFKPSFEQSGG